MLRRDLTGMLLGAAVGSMGSASVAQAQACPPPCAPLYPGDVTLYQGLNVGGLWDNAINAALAANEIVYFPPGHYHVQGPITITGNKTIMGPRGGTFAAQQARITHVPDVSSSNSNRNLFESYQEAYGGICIANLYIDGGRGGWAIRNVRPQSVFDSILMEVYDGCGIELLPCNGWPASPVPSGYGFGSWGCIIRDCKWTGLAEGSMGIGFQVAVNGGNVLLENCTAINGDIGINVEACEALVIDRPNVNKQWYGTPNKCGIRLAGPGVKKAISIRGGYIEACGNGVWAENVQALDIANTYFDTTENPVANSTCIFLQSSQVKSASIHGCYIWQRVPGRVAVSNYGSKTTLSNNVISAPNSGVAINNGAVMYSLANTILAGSIVSPAGWIKEIGA
jgi:hypothetical protein